MLFAEPAHPHDDPARPRQWAWRYGYFELLLTRGHHTLSLSRGPRYSVDSGRCCPVCRGSGWLPTYHRPSGNARMFACPTCPLRRTWFEGLPLHPLHLPGWVRNRVSHRRDERLFPFTLVPAWVRERAYRRGVRRWASTTNPVGGHHDELPF